MTRKYAILDERHKALAKARWSLPMIISMYDWLFEQSTNEICLRSIPF